MKKNLFFAAVLGAVALTACSKSESIVTELDQPKAISFENYMHKTTRAASVETSTLQTNGFKVSAYYTTGAKWYFKNQSVTYSSSKYSTTYYWPKTGSMDFYAVYPTTFTISDTKTFDYTNSAGTTDIVTASATAEDCASHNTTPSSVGLEFDHILTQIYFKALVANTHYYCKVSKITVTANSSATYTFGSGWGTVSTSQDYTYINLASGSEQTINSTSAAIVGTSIAANSLMLIPQGDGSADIATIKVYYKSYDAATNEEIADFSADATAKSFTVKQWQAKKSINYQLTLPVGAEPIEFTASVNNWDAESTVEPTL